MLPQQELQVVHESDNNIHALGSLGHRQIVTMTLHNVFARGTYPISSWLRRWVRRGFHRRLCVHWWTMWPLDWTSSIKPHDEACWNAYASSCRL